MTAPQSFALRPATDADLGALADLLTAVNPRHPQTAESLAHDLHSLRSHPLGLHVAQWVAHTPDGALLGAASALQFGGMYHPDRYHAEVGVHPGARGQGSARRSRRTSPLTWRRGARARSWLARTRTNRAACTS